MLKAADAAFTRDGEVLVAPFSVELAAGARAELECSDARCARIAARMAAGIVKPTSGKLLICDFDPRIQPVQAKRLAGYVPWNGDFGFSPLWQQRRQTIHLHAALFEVPCDRAEAQVASTLEQLARPALDDEMDPGVAFAVALALMRPIVLLVCDRPPATHLDRIAELVHGKVALFSTGTAVKAPGDEVLAAR